MKIKRLVIFLDHENVFWGAGKNIEICVYFV